MKHTIIEGALKGLRGAIERAGFDPGDLAVETWSPGDGKTRYRLTARGESRNVTGHFLGKGEFRQFLNETASLLNHLQREAPRPGAKS